MYTDETVLDYGKYKNKKLKDIPSDYFINVCKTGGNEHTELKKYIEENIGRFPGISIFVFKHTNEFVPFICEKRTYPTKKAAMDSIAQPTKQQKKKPIRAYECEKCSGWHLTSMPIELFKEIKKNNPLQE